jgi:hypothetical protein
LLSDGETLGLLETDGLTLGDLLSEGDTLGLLLTEGLTETDGLTETEGLALTEGLTLGDLDTLGLTETEGLTEGDMETICTFPLLCKPINISSRLITSSFQDMKLVYYNEKDLFKYYCPARFNLSAKAPDTPLRVAAISSSCSL